MLVAKRYRLGPSIGRGGMGEVFRATDEVLGRPVAVKLLVPSERDPKAAERFHREARAAARLSDPHVVSVYDFGHHEDGFFLVMELVEGPTVADELARHGPLPVDRAIDIAEQAAAGLAAAHREDVVHRDVKPGNLLVAPGGTVKVADFGIAHVPGQGATTLTATGQIIGSSHYLAPERAQGGQAGAPSDVYSLGCVLYQLVTGRPPFTADNPTAILYQHVDAAPVPPSQLRAELAGPFENVLLQMLAKDPAVRPSAAEIAAGSLRAQQHANAWRGIAAVPAVVPPATTPLEVAAVPARRSPKALLAGMVAALATTAAVMAGVALYGDEPNLPPTTDVGPRPGGQLATPGAGRSTTVAEPGATATSSTGQTQPAPANQANPTTSVPASPAPTAQPSTPATSAPTTTPSTGTTPQGTTSSSVPTPTSTPSAPPESTPVTDPSPSDTPPPETTTTPPPTETPTPDAERNSSPPPSN